MISSVVLIEAEPARVADLAEELVEVDGVSEVYSVTGEYDLVAMVRVRRHEDLATVVPEGISRLAGIRRTHSMVAFKAYRDADFVWDFD